MGEPVVSVAEVGSLEQLPADALALFGQDAFSTLSWYRSTVADGLPDGARACFHCAMAGGRTVAVLPMLREGRRLGALVTPYTCLWQPLLAPGLDTGMLVRIGEALAVRWRRHGVVRLAAMAAGLASMETILEGLRGAGLRTIRFAQFANWHLGVGQAGWEGYLAGRPGALRSAIKRHGARLMQRQGAVFSVVAGGADLDAAIAGYEAVYAASWKEAEPRPTFNATLMRACAADGSLRLGTIALAGVPIAVQFWLVHPAAAWACVVKLAHDEAHRALAPGTVLTGLMIRHLLDEDGVEELDFGRGDDPYKRMWTGERRQREGMLVVNPWRPSGRFEIVRHGAARILKRAPAE